MRSFLVIGMGDTGKKLAYGLLSKKNDVMIVDENPELIDPIAQDFTDAQIGDCRNEYVLKSLGVNNFDVCFVTIGENFQSSLEITSLLKETGAKRVISKASSDIQEKFLLRNGADAVFYPERDAVQKLTVLYNTENVFNFIELSNDYSIYEIQVLKEWIGHSIVKLDIRKKYNINIVAVKHADGSVSAAHADYLFDENDHVFIIGKTVDINRLVK